MLMKTGKCRDTPCSCLQPTKGLIAIAPPLGTQEKDDKALSTLNKKNLGSITSIAPRKRRLNEQRLLGAGMFCSFYCICIVKAINLSPSFIINIMIQTWLEKQ